MYQIICITDGSEHVLMDMRDEDFILQSPVLKLEINGAGSLSFKIFPTHPEIHSIKPLVSIIKVYKLVGNAKKWMFSGRVMTSEKDIYNTGKVECEGLLAFLLDSRVRPYEYSGTPIDYVKQLIECHNAQVDKSKRFKLGNIDLADADSNNYIVRANSNYPDTYNELRDKVVKLLGAYISVREETDGMYFDCVQTYDVNNMQEIRFGENIIDLTQTDKAEEIRTVMIGLGAEDDEGKRPSCVIENNEAIKVYGRIEGVVEFEDVTTQTQLEKKTTAYLDSVINQRVTVEVKALDLSMTDSEIKEITLGYANVVSHPNGINQKMLISKIQLYLMQPDKNTFTLGAEKPSLAATLSHNSADVGKRIQSLANATSKRIQAAVDNATELITGAKGGYVVLDGDNNGYPERILIMDTADKETAKNVIQLNKNGIGFSTTGINGEYANAWTIDGKLVADFITSGTMFGDRIRGGTLEIGGEKDGIIRVIDASGNELGIFDVNGIDVKKGAVKGVTVTVGGSDNDDGVIYVKNSDGTTVIIINCNGINVNNAFKVDMEGKITAVAIDGDAVEQFSTMIDESDAMKKAKQAIKTAKDAADIAKGAADIAQETADTADKAASTAQDAADKAQGAADKAQGAADTANKAIGDIKITVTNLNETIIPDINAAIESVSVRVAALEAKHS